MNGPLQIRVFLKHLREAWRACRVPGIRLGCALWGTLYLAVINTYDQAPSWLAPRGWRCAVICFLQVQRTAALAELWKVTQHAYPCGFIPGEFAVVEQWFGQDRIEFDGGTQIERQVTDDE